MMICVNLHLERQRAVREDWNGGISLLEGKDVLWFERGKAGGGSSS